MENKTEIIYLRISPEEKEQVRAIADYLHISISELTRILYNDLAKQLNINILEIKKSND